MAGRKNREGYILDMGIRCVFLVLDGINCDVWLAYMYLASSDGLSPLSHKGKVWRRPKKYLKSPTIERLRTPSVAFPTSIMDTTRARYSGPSRKLVVALDIGTTFSGAAYAFLDPGEIPQIRSVTKQVFPSIPGSSDK